MQREEQVVAVRREWVDQSLQILRKERGAGPGPRTVPGGFCQQGSRHLRIHPKEEPGRFNHTVTQMSQHDYRERIIVGACRPIFSRRAQDKEA